MCPAGVSTQAKAALSAAFEATSGVQAAASDALQSLNQATSGAVDQAGAVFKDLSSGVTEVTSSLQVLPRLQFSISPWCHFDAFVKLLSSCDLR